MSSYNRLGKLERYPRSPLNGTLAALEPLFGA